MDLSFSGAGFMGCYYFGVVNCFNKYVPRERIRRAAGASAGALSAAYYLLDLPIEPCLKEIMDLLAGIRQRPLGVFDRNHQIVDMLPERLNKMFPEDAHKIVNGRLFVGMTRLKDMKCVIVNEFESKKDLIDALNCSCFIPVWSGNHVSTFRGVKHIDGGFTNNLPVFDEHTIRICCFSGASDIAPNDGEPVRFLSGSVLGMPLNWNRANLKRGRRALWPPSAEFIVSILEQGYNDTKEFILSNDLIQCDKCFGATQPDHQTIYSKLTPTISPAASPALSRASSYMDLGDLQRASSYRKKGNNCQHEHAKRDGSQKGGRQRYLSSSSSSKESDGASQPLRQVSPSASKRSSFGSLLRDKLHLVAAGKQSPGGAGSPTNDHHADDEHRHDRASDLCAPQIVIEPADMGADSGVEATDSEQPNKRRAKLIGEIMQLAGQRDLTKSKPQEKAAKVKTIKETSTISSSSSSSSSSSTSSINDQEIIPIKMKRYTENRRQSQQLAPEVSPAERFLASRRATQAAIDTSKLLLPAKFVSTADLLPSCPPSPNLNRHCNECIRMRQEARQDGLDESIRAEAERYRKPRSADEQPGGGGAQGGGGGGGGGGGSGEQKPAEASKLRSKLRSPLRWFRSQVLSSRTKYDFVVDESQQVAQVGGQPATSQAALETVAY